MGYAKKQVDSWFQVQQESGESKDIKKLFDVFMKGFESGTVKINQSIASSASDRNVESGEREIVDRQRLISEEFRTISQKYVSTD